MTPGIKHKVVSYMVGVNPIAIHRGELKASVCFDEELKIPRIIKDAITQYERELMSSGHYGTKEELFDKYFRLRFEDYGEAE